MKTYAIFDSSNIDSVSYDDKKLECIVHFKSGYTYIYNSVTEKTFMLFYESNSKGKAIRTILGNHSFSKIKD